MSVSGEWSWSSVYELTSDCLSTRCVHRSLLTTIASSACSTNFQPSGKECQPITHCVSNTLHLIIDCIFAIVWPIFIFNNFFLRTHIAVLKVWLCFVQLVRLFENHILQGSVVTFFSVVRSLIIVLWQFFPPSLLVKEFGKDMINNARLSFFWNAMYVWLGDVVNVAVYCHMCCPAFESGAYE